MADMNCPSGFLMTYDEGSGKYIPFLMKTRDQEIIWHDHENVLTSSVFNPSTYSLTEVDKYITGISTYYIDYFSSVNDTVTENNIYTSDKSELCNVTRHICNIPTNAESMSGIPTMIIIDTLETSSSSKTILYSPMSDEIPNDINEVYWIDSNGDKIYNEEPFQLHQLTQKAIYKMTVPDEEDPDVMNDIYGIEYSIDNSTTFNSIKNAGYTINIKSEVFNRYDHVPTKKHIIEYPYKKIPETYEVSSDGTTDIYIKLLFKNMVLPTVDCQFDDNSESNAKHIRQIWDIPTRFRHKYDARIEYSVHALANLNICTSGITVYNNGAQIIVDVMNPLYPFSFTDGKLNNIKDSDYILVHINERI